MLKNESEIVPIISLLQKSKMTYSDWDAETSTTFFACHF